MEFKCAGCGNEYDYNDARQGDNRLYCATCYPTHFKQCNRAGCYRVTSPLQEFCSASCIAITRHKAKANDRQKSYREMRKLQKSPRS